MPSAVERFPCHIIELMNFVTRSDPYTASAGTVRFAICPFLGIALPVETLLATSQTQQAASLRLALLRSLRSVLRASLHTIGDAHGIQRSANHVIAHTRQILHAASADQHNRVLLQVVTDSGDIRRDFNAIRQPYTRNLPQRRVRLLRGLRVDAGTDAALLRTSLQRRARRLVTRPLAPLGHQLIKSRHSCHSLPAHAFAAHSSKSTVSDCASVGMTGHNRPLLLVTHLRSQSHTRTDERFWIPVKTYAADGGARPNCGGTPFRQPCPAYPFARAKGAAGAFQRGMFPNLTSIRKPYFSKARPLRFCSLTHARKKSRHTTSLDELAEPN